MAHMQANGISMYYDEVGSGPPVVLGHSLLLDYHLYDEVTEYLARRWRVIRPDFRGHGQSDKPKYDYSIDDMTCDALAFVDGLGLDRFMYAGLSMGGMIGMRAAVTWGKRLQALVLMDTSAQEDPHRATFEQWAADAKDRDPTDADIDAFIGMSVSRRYSKTNPPALGRLRAQLKTNDPLGNYYAQVAVLRRDDCVERLSQVSAPTLMVVGEKDILTPLALAQVIQGAILGAELKIVPEVGHLSALEKPNEIAEAIDTHFQTHWKER